MKGRNLYDVVDTACKQYLASENKKEVESKDKK